MGGLFSSGPSAGDIRRSEEQAFAKEQERLRIAEQKLRRRTSAETIQGEGIATSGNVEIGTDLSVEDTGLETAVARENPFGQTDPTESFEATDPNSIRDRIANGNFDFNFGNIKF